MVIQMVMRRMCPLKFGSHVARRVSPAGGWPLPRAASIPCSNTSIAAEEVMSPNLGHFRSAVTWLSYSTAVLNSPCVFTCSCWQIPTGRSTPSRRRLDRRFVGTQRVQLARENLDPANGHSFVQQTLRRKGLLPPAFPERFRRCGHLHDQTTLAAPDGNEVVVLVEGLRFVVYGINDDEPAAADFRCGDGFA
jgi:hypothetical protein